MTVFLGLIAGVAQAATAVPPPIIDMHLHAETADAYGPPGQRICAPYGPWPERDPRKPIDDYLQRFSIAPGCSHSFVAPVRDDDIRDRSIAALRRFNIVAVASGNDPARVEHWRKLAPDRIISGLSFGDGKLPSIAQLRTLHAAGRLQVMGEIDAQYAGIAPNDPRLEPYYALAEELDIPVGIHVGPGPPGIAYFGSPNMRLAHGNALLLEEVVIRHPKLRIYVMHSGWPLAEPMIALMYAYPQVYVDTGIIGYGYPRADFHAYLKRLVDAGFGERIMFGSDQMIWPDAISAAIESITSAPFLSEQQKRDILYHNAARFLRLKP